VLQHVPILIVWGEHDHILPASHGERAHALLPHSDYVVFADAAHEPHVTDPARMAELLTSLHQRCRHGRTR